MQLDAEGRVERAVLSSDTTFLVAWSLKADRLNNEPSLPNLAVLLRDPRAQCRQIHAASALGSMPPMRLYTEQQCIFTDTIDAQLFRQYFASRPTSGSPPSLACSAAGLELVLLARTNSHQPLGYSPLHCFPLQQFPLPLHTSPSLGDTFAGGTPIAEEI